MVIPDICDNYCYKEDWPTPDGQQLYQFHNSTVIHNIHPVE